MDFAIPEPPRAPQSRVRACVGEQGTALERETVAARIFADMRALRLFEGRSQVQRWSLAERIPKGSRTKEKNA